MTGMRVLITGGAGYIGSVLTRQLLEHGHAVTVLDNFMYGQNSLPEAEKKLKIVRGDSRDATLVRSLVRNADVVMPLAALVGMPICDRMPDEARAVNLDAVRMLCAELGADQRVLFPVTNSGYGIGQSGALCTEASPLRPISLYARTKVEAEEVVLSRPNSVTFRLATAFGVSPRMRIDLLVNDFVWRAVTEKSIVLYEGHFKRNYIHVRDTACVFLHGMDHFDSMKGRSYNVGLDNANLSKSELCRLIQNAVPDFAFTESAEGEDVDKRNYVVSNERILATGFRPSLSLEAGIRELVEYFQVWKPAAKHANHPVSRP